MKLREPKLDFELTKTPHISPSLAVYRVSVVRISQTFFMLYYIMAGHAIVVVKDITLLFIMETLLFWHCGND